MAEGRDSGRNVETLLNDGHDNPAGPGAWKDTNYIEKCEGGRPVEARGTLGWYVRLYGHGNAVNNLNHSSEVETYGTIVEQDHFRTC